MNPLAALYGGIVRARNQMYERGTFQERRLQGPVVSVGNLSVGGSGKTPFVIALGELLCERGISFDVLSRGYRRATKGVAQVDPQGSPRDFGDEPLLIARRLQVPVIVGEERYAAGQFAEQKFGPQLHLLDDGFQHRQLARDFDMVLVNAGDVQDTLLPAGRLREPLSSLERADAIVLTNGAPIQGLRLGCQQLWRVSRGIVAPQIRSACVAFCGIAKPENFFADLRAAGVELVETLRFPDHHAYSDHDVRRLLAMRKGDSTRPFLTTEKDAINLGAFTTQLAPLHVARVKMEIEDAAAVVDTVMAATTRPHAPSA